MAFRNKFPITLVIVNYMIKGRYNALHMMITAFLSLLAETVLHLGQVPMLVQYISVGLVAAKIDNGKTNIQ